MTRDEVKKMLLIIESSFPTFKVKDSFMVDTWHRLLSEDDYGEIQRALYAYIRTDATGFAPSIGQILEISRKLKAGYDPTEGEIWSMVYKALCNANYHGREEFESLPKRIQKAIGSYEVLRSWAQSDMSELEVIKSNFLKAYRVSDSREKECEKLPAKYREMLEGTVKKLIGG